ncbi:MAG: FAD-dependent oxidoreductase [Chloroflexi bacterium]|nr:FAD-dependent oxidoreductase [Chloroflexota bacterium]
MIVTSENGSTPFDLIVISAGINGAGIARGAALRGLRVLLDKVDIASGTMSWSTRLIHGGLRYLEHRECGLAHESLRERECLLHRAPSLQPQHRLQPFQGGGVRLAQVAPVKNAPQVRLPAQSLHPVRS